MDTGTNEVVGRLRLSRDPYWLRVIDAADLDGALPTEPNAAALVEPYRLLLERIGDGVTVTKAGYLPPATVRAITDELGWNEPWLGTSNRELDVRPTLILRASAQDLGLIRRYRGQFVATRQARGYLDDPARIWWHIAERLPVGSAEPQRHAGLLFLLIAAAGLPIDEARVAAGLTMLGWSFGPGIVTTIPDHVSFDVFRGTWRVFDRLGLAAPVSAPDREPSPEARRLARAALLGRDHVASGPATPTAGPVTMQRLRVTLNDIDPPIWRRIGVPDTTTLEHLHLILQTSIGWRGAHLYMFTIDGVIAGDVEELDGHQVDASTFTVADAARRTASFTYDYDFGDGWEHEVVVEEAVDGVGTGVPELLDGERLGPPEDCGGPRGYQRLRGILADPEHDEHGDVLDWLRSCAIEPDRVVADVLDIDSINAELVLYDRHHRR